MRLISLSLILFGVTFGPSFALGGKVSISKIDCLGVLKHPSQSDVEYQPGVDIRGKKVDLYYPQIFEINNQSTFDLNLNIAKKYDI